MEERKAMQLITGTIVMWDERDMGIVERLNEKGFLVIWVDGQSGWINYKDAERVSIPRSRPGWMPRWMRRQDV